METKTFDILCLQKLTDPIKPLSGTELARLFLLKDSLLYCGISYWKVDVNGCYWRHTIQLGHLVGLKHIADDTDEMEQLMYDLDDLENDLDLTIPHDVCYPCFWYLSQAEDNPEEYYVSIIP